MTVSTPPPPSTQILLARGGAYAEEGVITIPSSPLELRERERQDGVAMGREVNADGSAVSILEKGATTQDETNEESHSQRFRSRIATFRCGTLGRENSNASTTTTTTESAAAAPIFDLTAADEGSLPQQHARRTIELIPQAFPAVKPIPKTTTKPKPTNAPKPRAPRAKKEPKEKAPRKPRAPRVKKVELPSPPAAGPERVVHKTITALATAAFLPAAQSASSLERPHTLDGFVVTTREASTPIKPKRRSRKKPEPPRPELLSPRTALRRIRSQTLVFSDPAEPVPVPVPSAAMLAESVLGKKRQRKEGAMRMWTVAARGLDGELIGGGGAGDEEEGLRLAGEEPRCGQVVMVRIDADEGDEVQDVTAEANEGVERARKSRSRSRSPAVEDMEDAQPTPPKRARRSKSPEGIPLPEVAETDVVVTILSQSPKRTPRKSKAASVPPAEGSVTQSVVMPPPATQPLPAPIPISAEEGMPIPPKRTRTSKSPQAVACSDVVAILSRKPSTPRRSEAASMPPAEAPAEEAVISSPPAATQTMPVTAPVVLLPVPNSTSTAIEIPSSSPEEPLASAVKRKKRLGTTGPRNPTTRSGVVDLTGASPKQPKSISQAVKIEPTTIIDVADSSQASLPRSVGSTSGFVSAKEMLSQRGTGASLTPTLYRKRRSSAADFSLPVLSESMDRDTNVEEIPIFPDVPVQDITAMSDTSPTRLSATTANVPGAMACVSDDEVECILVQPAGTKARGSAAKAKAAKGADVGMPASPKRRGRAPKAVAAVETEDAAAADTPASPKGRRRAPNTASAVQIENVAAAAQTAGSQMPNFAGYTTAQLQTEIAKYGFKPTKSRTAMAEILNQCWKAMHPEATGLTSTSAAPVATVTPTATKVVATKAKGKTAASKSPTRRTNTPPITNEASGNASPMSEAAILARLYTSITTSIKASPTQWSQILRYEPILLEDLTLWLSSEEGGKIEVSEEVLKGWCDKHGICCFSEVLAGWRTKKNRQAKRS
ncbi:5'-flap endonuclease [Saitoella coloradoensis]